jgi:hypothetical protein
MSYHDERLGGRSRVSDKAEQRVECHRQSDTGDPGSGGIKVVACGNHIPADIGGRFKN